MKSTPALETAGSFDPLFHRVQTAHVANMLPSVSMAGAMDNVLADRSLLALEVPAGIKGGSMLFLVLLMVGSYRLPTPIPQPVMAAAKPREKLSVSLPESSVLFVEQYRKTYSVASRSEVIDIALHALRERELERAYAESAREESAFGDFESTSADGLEDDPAW